MCAGVFTENQVVIVNTVFLKACSLVHLRFCK